jgi:hypothetical protein
MRCSSEWKDQNLDFVFVSSLSLHLHQLFYAFGGVGLQPVLDDIPGFGIACNGEQ